MSHKNSFESEDCSASGEEEINTEAENKEDSPQSKIPNNKLIKAIAITLTSILDQNKNLENYKEILKNQSRAVFSANIIPNISVKDYLERIQTYSNVEKSTLIISLIYIDRLCNKAKVLIFLFFN